MFWNIFIDSLVLIIGVLVIGWFIASLIRRHEQTSDVD